jgi:type 1 glutamine amidotransferase
MRKALIVWGGWLGHQPREVAEVFRRILSAEGFGVEVRDTLDAFRDYAGLADLHLIVPIWTMGKLLPEQARPVLEAVAGAGVGVAGCHGGMCDAFREHTEWQFMTGGQWVAHPGDDKVKYRVEIRARDHEVTRGVGDFDVTSEQYYLHVDPAVTVLATTRFPAPGVEGPHVVNGPVDMPQVWTKRYGRGRIFYNALGHQAAIFEIPEARELMRRGFLWAAKAEGGE